MEIVKNRCVCGECPKCKYSEGYVKKTKETVLKEYNEFLKDFHKRGEYTNEDFAKKREFEAFLR